MTFLPEASPFPGVATAGKTVSPLAGPLHPMQQRTRIAAIVQAAPGSNTRTIAQQLALDASTADYHLRRLLKEGKVVQQRQGRELCWFSSRATPCPVVRRLVVAFRREETRAVARALEEDLPKSSLSLAEETGIERQRVRWAMGVLTDIGIAERTRSGRVLLAEGASTCLAKGLSGEPCGMWGACPVSRKRVDEGQGGT